MADISQEVQAEMEVRQYKQISVNGSIPLGPRALRQRELTDPPILLEHCTKKYYYPDY